MAVLKVFSVRDEKIGIYMKPFMDAHLGNALRSWTEACNEPQSPFCKYPTDFTLYEVGTFDDLEGRLIPLTVPHKISTASEVIREPAEKLPFRAAN